MKVITMNKWPIPSKWLIVERGVMICFIAVLLIIIAFLVQYHLLFNANSFQNLFARSDYSAMTYQKLSEEFAYYVDDDLKAQLLEQEQVAADVDDYVAQFFDREERLFASQIERTKEQEFAEIIQVHLDDSALETDDDAVQSLSSLLAGKYVNTVFPVQELELVEPAFQQVNRLMGNFVLVFVLALIAVVNFQWSFKNKQYIAESFAFANVFLLVMSFVLLFYRPFFFNQPITSFMMTFMNQIIIINLVIFLIYGAVSFYAYYKLYQNRIRQ